MPRNYNLIYSVIWTAAFICASSGAPMQGESENLLARFIGAFKEQKCSVLDNVVVPKCKLDNQEDTQQDDFVKCLTFQLEVCTGVGKTDPENFMCNEAFDVAFNISTCRNGSETLNQLLLGNKPVNITIQVDDVCEGFVSDQNILPKAEQYIAFVLADGKICPLACKGVMKKACAFLLWGYRVQAAMQEIESLAKTVVSDKTTPGSQSVKQSGTQDVQNKTLETAGNTVPLSKVTLPTKENPSVTGQGVTSYATSQKKEKKPHEAKSSTKASHLSNSKQTSVSVVSLPVEGQDSQTKPRVSADPPSEQEHNETGDVKPSVERTSGHTGGVTLLSEPTNGHAGGGGVPSPEKATNGTGDFTASSNRAKGDVDYYTNKKTDINTGVEVSGKPANVKITGTTAGLGSNDSRSVKAKSFKPPIKVTENTVQVNLQSDQPKKNTVQDNMLDIGKEKDTGATKTIPESSKITLHSSKSSTAVSASENQGSIPNKNSNSDGKSNVSPIFANSLEKAVSEKDVPGLTLKKEMPTNGVAVLQSMDEKSLPTDEEDSYNDIHVPQPISEDDEDSFSEPLNGAKDKQSSEPQSSIAAVNGAKNDAVDNGAKNDAVDNGAKNDAVDNGASSNALEESQIISRMQATFPGQEDTHFFFYFITIVLFVIGGYVLFHNKQKIFALIIEGRHERRRRSGANYRKLETK